MPRLSILLSVYNGGSFLSDAIESILNQTFKDFELIIADDGSSDDSKQVIESYGSLDKRIIVSHNEKNLGKTATINRLYELSSFDKCSFDTHEIKVVSTKG